MKIKTWQLYDAASAINNYLESKGYDKRIKIHPDRLNQHFQICLHDICGNYTYIEYGNYTRDKAYLVLSALYVGIGLGSLDYIVSM